MTTITNNIIAKAAIAISSFIKNLDANITAGVHDILLVDGVQVSVEIKLNDETIVDRETYVATGRVAGLTVCKVIGFKSPSATNCELETRPSADIMLTKICKVMLDNAAHKGDTFYDLQCAVNNPKENEVFRGELATGHIVTVSNGVAKIYDVNGGDVAEIVLAHYTDFGLAMVQINRAIYGDMTVAPFAAFNLKG